MSERHEHRLDIDGAVATITFERAAAYNAMTRKLLLALQETLRETARDPAVRALVITGAGKAFCAGQALDDAETISLNGRTDLYNAVVDGFNPVINALITMDKPVVAAVNGVAAGAGLSALAWCDLAIAADTATFTSAYTKIGFTPDGSSTWFLSRLIGRRRAMELYLTNRVLTAQEALDWGLVNRVVPATDLMAETGKLAAQLAAGPTRAYGGVKQLLHRASMDSLESQMEYETRMLSEMAASADAREGVAAFVEKRRPHFSGE